MDRRGRVLGAAVLLAAAGAWAGGCTPTRALEMPRGPHFSVLTYNVNFGGPGADRTVDVIADLDADIVCLQETTPEWEALLRGRLGAQYPRMTFMHFGGAGGMAVLSRLEVSQVERVPPGAGWFPAWVFHAATPCGPVQVACVHFRPGLREDGKVSAGAFLAAGDIRRREAEALWGRLKPGMPTLVLGDFNEGGGRAVEYLASRGMTDALAEFDRTSHTWRWPTAVGTVTARFDHVFHGASLRCLRAEVFDRGASDHLPIRAVFEGAGRDGG